MPPHPMSPSRTLSLGPGSAARTDRTKGEVRLLAASGARLAAKADLPRNLRREIFVIMLTSDDRLRNTVPLPKRSESATHIDVPSSRIARTDDALETEHNDSPTLKPLVHCFGMICRRALVPWLLR